ncbi:MAG: hypothetical protein RJA07_2151 [Bacteroidota bacterium]|jgi:hypothetical protein
MLTKKRFNIALFLIVFGFAACNTNPYLVNNLQPNGDYLNGNVTDTFTVICKNVYHDSVVANNLQTLTVGTISNNATFGKTDANLYVQFNLPASQFAFETGTVVDSIFVMFPYRGTYAEITNPLNLSMTLVDAASSNKIAESTIYYSNKTFALSSTNIGSKANVTFSVIDSAKEYGKTIQPLLKIPVSNTAFIADLISQNGSTTGSFYDNTSFHNYLNGVYLNNTATNANGLLQLSPTDAEHSGLMVYYHTPTADSQKILFPINAAGTVNHFAHDYNGSKVQQVIQANTNQDSIYVSGIAGVRSKIFIPGLSALKNTIINKAEITFENVDATSTSLFKAPGNLLLTRINAADGKEISLEDVTEGSPISTLSSANYYGGIYTNGKYTFNIARYLQKLERGIYTNDGFYIEAYNAAERPAQVVLGGNNLSSYKIKLKILFTKIH